VSLVVIVAVRKARHEALTGSPGLPWTRLSNLDTVPNHGGHRGHPGRLRLVMRRRCGTLIVAALALTAAGLLAYWQHRRELRPTVPKVVAAISGGSLDERLVAAARRIDGLGFVGFSGWRITGGRTDEVGDRKTTTAIYARGRQHISYTVVSGAAHVNYGTATAAEYRATPAGRVELNWLDGVTPDAEVIPHPAAYVLTFKRDSRTTVLVGTPYRVSVARAMRRLALASFLSGERARPIALGGPPS
jgi:hypothetical protein